MIVEPRNRQFLAEINVIPLVDVVLVLLVIFMVTAPMLHRGLDLNLPTSTSNTIQAQERLIVTVQRDRKVFLDNDPVSLVALRTKLSQARQANPLVSVYLRADRSVPYGTIVQVMDEIKRAKIERLGMVTEPQREQVQEETIRGTQ